MTVFKTRIIKEFIENKTSTCIKMINVQDGNITKYKL